MTHAATNGVPHQGSGNGHAPIALARYRSMGVVRTGVVADGFVTELASSWLAALELLADGDPAQLTASQVGRAEPLADVDLLAPIGIGTDVYCVGLNYHEHKLEAGDLVDGPADEPIIFAKTLRAIAAPHAELELPAATSSEFDWEAELGVVIGWGGVGITAADAWAHVAGYTVVNDITARDLQVRHKQWHLGKNVIASTPIGPWVVQRTSVGTPPDLDVSLRVNGVEKQRGLTSQLIHSIPTLIELLSSVVSLQAGDIIATGTPSGVGFKRQPPEFLRDGDVVETSIGGVGTLVNVVRTSTIRLAGNVERAAELV